MFSLGLYMVHVIPSEKKHDHVQGTCMESIRTKYGACMELHGAPARVFKDTATDAENTELFPFPPHTTITEEILKLKTLRSLFLQFYITSAKCGALIT